MTSKPFKVIAFFSLAITLIWIVSYWISNNAFKVRTGSIGDMATVLFGAASIALFILSMFIAFIAVFGWQSLQESIKTSVESASTKAIDSLINEKIDPLAEELRGRVERLVAIEWRDTIQPLEIEFRGRVYS